MAPFGTHDLLLFAATVGVVNATPGVDVLLTLTTTWRTGVRGGLVVAAGIVSGCLVHSLLAAGGLAALLVASASAFAALKWAGAAYLLWLAAQLWREAWRSRARAGVPPGHPGARAAAPEPLGVLFRRGLLTNLLNPKVALFFLALLPQFMLADAPHKALAFLFLGGWFALQSSLFLALLVLLLAPLQRWQPGPRTQAGLQATGGLLFAALAMRLARSQPG